MQSHSPPAAIVHTSSHFPMENHFAQRAAYSSSTQRGKAKWVPKKHIPLSNDLRTLDDASTSHSISELSTPVPSVLPQSLPTAQVSSPPLVSFSIAQVSNTLRNTTLSWHNTFSSLSLFTGASSKGFPK